MKFFDFGAIMWFRNKIWVNYYSVNVKLCEFVYFHVIKNFTLVTNYNTFKSVIIYFSRSLHKKYNLLALKS